MYIKSAEITNIRSIDNFKIEFENPAGWHVLIGDNGSGKSTIIRSIALALVGPDERPSLFTDWRDWLKNNEQIGTISLKIEPSEIDKHTSNDEDAVSIIPNVISFEKEGNSVSYASNKEIVDGFPNPSEYNWGKGYGWFSVAYGPFRRFKGGNQELTDKAFANQPKLGAHLSVFGEDVALTEVTEWLKKLDSQQILRRYNELFRLGIDAKMESKFKDLYSGDRDDFYKFLLFQALENRILKKNELISTIAEKIIDDDDVKMISTYYVDIIDNIKRLINSPFFLPNNTKLERISSEEVFFKNSNGNLITINQLSDGYRSILSLTFELIRQLIRVYGDELVFKNIQKNQEDSMNIDLPGVVLIDEIDAHLHPTWQTKIGQWFLKYFPNIQFIVTTHSPLVCRAAEKGTIWKLAAPGSGEKSKQITGIERERLINGNVLDAYGTEAFGKNVSISEDASHKIERLAELNVKSIMGTTDDNEEQELQGLKAIYPTEKVK